MAVRALRGATTIDEDTPEQITLRVQELMNRLLEANGVAHDDLISVFFTATADVISMFPATAARGLGLGDVPLICAQEIPVAGAMDHCIRVLVHTETDLPRSDLHHVYLQRAKALRDDLPD
jgi:chorismate mutase